MTETYAFLFCLALGLFARFLFICANALAKRTDLLPVTFVIDILTVFAVGGAFTLYVVLTGTPLAPYMFAALFSGYLFTYWLTRSDKKPAAENKHTRAKRKNKSRRPTSFEKEVGKKTFR